jgi:branched-chain amino acid transport system substrate-binding protein
MFKQRKNLGLVAVALALAVALVVSSCAPAKPVGEEKTIKVGLSLIMTGPIASTGVPIAEGFIDYLRYVNDDLGGIEYRTPEGKTEKVMLDITWEDSAYSVPKGLTIHKRQKAQGIMLRIISSSSEGEALAEIVSRERIPTFTM